MARESNAVRETRELAEKTKEFNTQSLTWPLRLANLVVDYGTYSGFSVRRSSTPGLFEFVVSESEIGWEEHFTLPASLTDVGTVYDLVYKMERGERWLEERKAKDKESIRIDALRQTAHAKIRAALNEEELKVMGYK